MLWKEEELYTLSLKDAVLLSASPWGSDAAAQSHASPGMPSTFASLRARLANAGTACNAGWRVCCRYDRSK